MASWTKDSSGNWKKSESTKKNYTVIDGKKVEKVAETSSPSATSSSTWKKDTVTLEEAKQQTKDVESGVIDVDKGTTSIDTPATTETISLEQAAAQTETESSNRVTVTESAQASQTPTEVSKQVSTITSIDNNGNYAVTEETVTESTYNNLTTIKAGSSVKSAAQLDPVVKTETESMVVETGSVKSLYSIADPIDYSELNVSKSASTTETVQLSDAAMTAFSEQEISAAELSSSSTTTKPFALEEKFNNSNTENIINTTANAYDSVTAAIGKTVVVPAAKVADTIIEYADTSLESSDNKDYSKYEPTSLYGESEFVLKEAPTQTIANATANAAEKTAGYYVGAVSGFKETVKETLDAGNVFEVMDEGSGPNYQVNEKKVSETAAAKFVLSAGETIAMAPVAIPQAAVEIVKNPVLATKDFVVNTGESIIADPATGLGTVAGMLLTGSVIKGSIEVGKTGLKSLKASVPRVTLASEPQGFLLKKSGVTIAEDVSIVNDVLKIEAPKTAETPEIKIFAKSTGNGVADVYFKLTAEQAAKVSQNLKGNIRNISTSYGSFVEFEPTGVIKSSNISRSGLKSITTRKTPELIGDFSEVNNPLSLKNPLRLETRENIQPASVRGVNVPERLQLPEITYDLETTARTASETLALKSGRTSFWESEAAELLTKDKKKTVTNEMPWMKERVVQTKAELTFKDPSKLSVDFSPEFERLYKTAKEPEKIPTPRATLEASLLKDSMVSPRAASKKSLLGLGEFTRPNVSPAVNPLPYPIPQASPFPSTTPFPGLSSYTKPSTKSKTKAIPNLFPETSPSPDPAKYISDPVISDSFVKPKRGRKSTDYPIVPSFVPTRKSKKSKKGKNSSSGWEYDRLYNSYGDATKWRGF
ncbi:MAG: hypothetical protein A4E23_00070 [Methanomethylovorans sp. PtaU1.Bin073]|nr:MAG: hypothetical protein A4E23_00070 [Methanomethylovorans sp. PtaU1.Bin073]